MLVMAEAKHRLATAEETAYIEQFRHLPVAVTKVLRLENAIAICAKRFANKHRALYLGRGRRYPIALKGALQFKDLSYIHPDIYPACELKHGPLALVDADMPVIPAPPNDESLDHLNSNLKEVQARGAEL